MERFLIRYKINIDYIKKLKNKKKEKGDKINYYMINLDTFDKICMMSKSQKANSVRDYFITLRKFIQYYREHISDMIINGIIQHKFDYIYILLVNKDKNIFKIGKTEDIKKRLRLYHNGKDKHPDIQFILLVKNKDFIESCAKNLMMKYQFKKNQEIYKVDISLIKEFIIDCAKLSIKHDITLDDKKIDSYIIFENNDEIKKLDKYHNTKINNIPKKSSKK